MFKEIFNNLYVDVQDFIFESKSNKEFLNIKEQITYYKSIVDEYLTLTMYLENLLQNNDLLAYADIKPSIIKLSSDLNASFEVYKKNIIVIDYLYDLNVQQYKLTFSEKLYRFEQALVSKPLIKIDATYLETIMTTALDFANNTHKLYFYTNNPFIIDEKFSVVIPKKFEYSSKESFINAVYLYIFEIFNMYIQKNNTELQTLSNIEFTISEKIFAYNALLIRSNSHKINTELTMDAAEYYLAVNALVTTFKSFSTTIINLGVYRFYALIEQFNKLETQSNILINDYMMNSLYITYNSIQIFEKKLVLMQQYITFIEEGKINVSGNNIIPTLNFKELVYDVIALSRELKLKIYYTEKYNILGQPKLKEFEFYQTDLFLTEIKTYYYNLIIENTHNYTVLSIDDYGDATLNTSRNNFKYSYNTYIQYISSEVGYFTEFELQTFINSVIGMQNKVKIDAISFFDAAIKLSPATYTTIIENHYNHFLEQLKTDLTNITEKQLNYGLEFFSLEKTQALNILKNFNTHIKLIETAMIVANRYLFLGTTKFIENDIYKPLLSLYNDSLNTFKSGEYNKILSQNDEFDNTPAFNFNLLNTLYKLSDSTVDFFNIIDTINKIFVDEQLHGKPLNHDNISLMNDLFDDDTYKVLRNDLFNKLDIFYEHIILMKPNEKIFLLNEKNLKKMYFDNQLMKLNYMRIHHMLIGATNIYDNFDKTVFCNDSWYETNKKDIEYFNYHKTLEIYILNQNKVLADISKQILEYHVATTTIELTTDDISNIELFNIQSEPLVRRYIENIKKLQLLVEKIDIDKKRYSLLTQHKEQWLNVINNNNIIDCEQTSYDDMETFKGAAPFFVDMSAKLETYIDDSGQPQTTTFSWNFGNDIIKRGNHISHTFYEAGIYDVVCESSYTNGEKSSRFLKFDISIPTNTQVVKSDSVKYTPLATYVDQPKLTYKDSITGNMMTVPIKINSGSLDKIKTDAITIGLAADPKLSIEKNGMVVLGFNGVEFAGHIFDNNTIYNADFELPEESEFLFDFNVTNPIGEKSRINIINSKNIISMSKLNDVHSIYEIADAREYNSSGESVSIMQGDIIVMKNKMNRFIVIQIATINEFTKPLENKYYYEIVFNFSVNISLNKLDRHIFKPQETNITIPTIVFKKNVRELFNSLITRIEKINKLQNKKLISTNDQELIESLNIEISELENENKKFYIYSEYTKLKAKYEATNIEYIKLSNKFYINFDDTYDNIHVMIKQYRNHINSTKTLKEYMNSSHVYEFKKNLVDLEILRDLYYVEFVIMETLIDTYNYKSYDITYFLNKLSKIKIFNIIDETKLTSDYVTSIIYIVNALRMMLFKIKLVINFPIMLGGNYIVVDSNYTRPTFSVATNEYISITELDFYLLNKKLELRYGYETEKQEMGAVYVDFVDVIISEEKKLFGNGLSKQDSSDISKYIETVELATIGEYDDFFMMSLWLDYLKKITI